MSEKLQECDVCGKLTHPSNFGIDNSEGKMQKLCPGCWDARTDVLYQQNARMLSIDLSSGTLKVGRKTTQVYKLP